MQSKTKIQKKIDWNAVFRTLKWIVPFLIFYVLYRKIYINRNLSVDVLFEFFTDLDGYWYPILFIFTLLNWSVEVRKWQYLIGKIELQSFKTAYKSVLCGVAVSQLLPFRTGESIGRLAYVSNDNKITAALLSVAGSFTQLLMTVLFGLISFLILQPFGQTPFPLIVGILVLSVFLIIGYRKMPQFAFLRRNRFMQTVLDAYRHLNRTDMLRLLFFSALRYALFVLPYALLARYFQVGRDSDLLYLSMAVSCIFLLQTIWPGFIFSDLMIRISAPALIFSASSNGTGLEHLPGLIIYLFNVFLPMCIGAIVLLSLKLKNR